MANSVFEISISGVALEAQSRTRKLSAAAAAAAAGKKHDSPLGGGSKASSMRSSSQQRTAKAYATLLYGDEFLLGVRVLGKSIRDTGVDKRYGCVGLRWCFKSGN